MKQAKCEHIEAINIFDDWLLEIVTLDTQANFDLKCVADMAAESVAKCQRLGPLYENTQYTTSTESQNIPPSLLNYPTQNNHYNPNVSGANTILPLSQQNRNTNNDSNYHQYNSRGNNATSSGFRNTRCPKLTKCEIKLLNEHKGYRKCRKFYVPHTTINCTNDWPNAATYQTLTLEMALAAMAMAAVASVSSGSLRSQHQISRLPHNQAYFSASSFDLLQASQPPSTFTGNGFGGFMMPPSFSNNSADLPSAFIEESLPEQASGGSATVSAVLPSTMSNFVLGTED